VSLSNRCDSERGAHRRSGAVRFIAGAGDRHLSGERRGPVTDVLLPWYDRELEFFRRMAGDFAQRSPKIAARLHRDAQGAKDPHVERMIQAFAYLNARIRYKLEDDFPEITDAMLGVLYPHYLAPTPSMAVIQFQLKKGQADLPDGHPIPAG